jgi:hypothetical protein
MDTVPALKDATAGFELLGGTRIDQAQKLIDGLNDRVLASFVRSTAPA